MQNLEEVKELLSTPKRIVITAHANPDGDAIGSALGIYHYLVTQGHNVTVIMPTEMPRYYNWLEGFDRIWVYYDTRSFSQRLLSEAEVLFVLDYNRPSRVEEMADDLVASKAYKIMIDHHLYPDTSFVQAMLSETSASSACELVYDFIGMLGGHEDMSIGSMEALFVGLLTDTGGFRYGTSPKFFRMVAHLMERGVDNNRLNDLVFNSYSIKRFNLLAYTITDCIEILEDINAGIIILTKEDYKRFNIKRGDTEGIVNFVLKIRKLKVSAFIVERKDVVKVSMRSKGDFSVQEICTKYFGGGGHRNASGASVRKEGLQETVTKLKNILYTDYKEQLQA